MRKSIREIRQKVMPILIHYKIKKAGIFGSYTRGKPKKNSDIDILVEIGKDINLLDFIGIKLEIEAALKRKIDLVEYASIKPLIKDRILKEEVPII